MSLQSPELSPFNLRLQNLPIVNIRSEFLWCWVWLHREFPLVSNVRVILPQLIFYGLKSSFFSYALSRSILGIEAVVSTAVWHQLGRMGRLTTETSRYTRDPNGAPGTRGTAQAIYNNLPKLIHPDLQLTNCDPSLWGQVLEFYKAIRNPLFHGYELGNSDQKDVRSALKMIYDLHLWVDAWCAWDMKIIPPDQLDHRLPCDE